MRATSSRPVQSQLRWTVHRSSHAGPEFRAENQDEGPSEVQEAGDGDRGGVQAAGGDGRGGVQAAADRETADSGERCSPTPPASPRARSPSPGVARESCWQSEGVGPTGGKRCQEPGGCSLPSHTSSLKTILMCDVTYVGEERTGRGANPVLRLAPSGILLPPAPEWLPPQAGAVLENLGQSCNVSPLPSAQDPDNHWTSQDPRYHTGPGRHIQPANPHYPPRHNPKSLKHPPNPKPYSVPQAPATTAYSPLTVTAATAPPTPPLTPTYMQYSPPSQGSTMIHSPGQGCQGGAHYPKPSESSPSAPNPADDISMTDSPPSQGSTQILRPSWDNTTPVPASPYPSAPNAKAANHIPSIAPQTHTVFERSPAKTRSSSLEARQHRPHHRVSQCGQRTERAAQLPALSSGANPLFTDQTSSYSPEATEQEDRRPPSVQRAFNARSPDSWRGEPAVTAVGEDMSEHIEHLCNYAVSW
ncbi:hypothetical protein CRENBAI_009074 [Crenichthys baileyi]|uniref:Uncharacterized protein n=1 Tax=Crenichthys baileyi TaxID=28760 RepID=A0AAV9S188_9TELE